MSQDGNGKGAILAVPPDNGGCKLRRLRPSRLPGEPRVRGFDSSSVFFRCFRNCAERCPAESGGRYVADALGRIAPASIFIGVGGKPLKTVINNAVMFGASFPLDNLQCDHGGGGGKGTTGQLADPMPLFVTLGEQRRARGLQRGLESGGVDGHESWEGLRFF